MDFTGVARVARRQGGFVTLADCRDLGVPERTVQGWVAAGRLEGWHPALFGVAGLPATFERRLRAGLLAAGPGAAVSHRAAAQLWGLVTLGIAEITVPYEQRLTVEGVVIHRSRDLDRERLHVRAGLQVTGPMRAIIDCGAVLPQSDVRDLLERGLADRLFTITAIERAYGAVARPGRRGSGVVRGARREGAGARGPGQLA